MSEYTEEREFSVGPIKSDSGNHFVDVMTVILVICFMYIGKVFMKKVFKE